jgi:Viral coat protein P2 N-terminal domain
MQFIRKLEPFQNVLATGRAVLSSKLVLGNVIERVYLVLGGGAFTKAMITAVRVRLNGKVVFGDVSGTNLDLIQRYLLLNNTAGYLTIDFTEPVSRSIQGQLMGAYNTNAAGVTDFTIEVDIAGATTPTLDAWVQMRSPDTMAAANGFDPQLAPVLRALIPTTIPVTAAGEIQADVNYGSGGASLIKRLFIVSTVLTSFRIKRDSLDVFETVAPALNTYIELDYGRVAQANVYVWDPLMDGNQSDAYPTRRADKTPSNFQFLFTASGAGSHLVLADVYSTLGAL